MEQFEENIAAVLDSEEQTTQSIECRQKASELREDDYTKEEARKELLHQFPEISAINLEELLDEAFSDNDHIWKLATQEIIDDFLEQLQVTKRIKVTTSNALIDGQLLKAKHYIVMAVIEQTYIKRDKGISMSDLKDYFFLQIMDDKLSITQKELYHILQVLEDDWAYPGKIIIRNYQKNEFRIWDDKKEEIVTNTSITPLLQYSPLMLCGMDDLASFRGASKSFLYDLGRTETFIGNTAQFTNALQKYKKLIEFNSRMTLTEKKLHEEYIINNTNWNDRFSYVREYDMDERTRMLGKEIQPEDNGFFRKFVETFTLEDDKSVHRVAAGILSSFLPRQYDGNKPFFLIVADFQSSGKSYVVKIIANVVDGVKDGYILFKGKGKDHQQISGISKCGRKVVCFDNLRDITKEQELEITLAITSPTCEAWFMHQAHDQVVNNKTYWGTLNSEISYDNDVLARTLLIKMKDGRDVGVDKKAKLEKQLQFLVENREKIIANIHWYMQQERKDVAVKKHDKFPEWSEMTGGILGNVFPDVDEFDFSISEEEKKMSSEYMLMDEFLEKIMAGKKHQTFTNDVMFTYYKRNYGGGTNSHISMGTVTKRIKNIAKSMDGWNIEHKPLWDKESGKTKRGFIIEDLKREKDDPDEDDIIKELAYA